ncbi:Oidioi.mRNA.OKI2018_I69.chr1.g910.t1.cds [Oikopleura dioica]|uniref:Oidioi.mRNA.OKI2018_I69.chr1.g910.t1.cds n=1 Tax=Oikopleura dioica TaxID=34765 RepID=A0ABN7SVK3_OIKDI|nr:Oidioi.mRNA.OKI2018_I69.chr1.g910.t1.cds [Oikopleura dioica]
MDSTDSDGNLQGNFNWQYARRRYQGVVMPVDWRNDEFHIVEEYDNPNNDDDFLFDDCTDGEFMEITVNQWFGENNKIYRRAEIDGILRAVMVSDGLPEDKEDEALRFVLGGKTFKTVDTDFLVKDLEIRSFGEVPPPAMTPPVRDATCEETLIGSTPVVAIDSKEFQTACPARSSSEYEVKVKVECNFSKFSKLRSSWSYIISSRALGIRAVSGGMYQGVVWPLDYYNDKTYINEEFVNPKNEVDDYIFNDCTDGEFMEITVNQWFGEDGKIYKRTEIDGIYRAVLVSEGLGENIENLPIDFFLGSQTFKTVESDFEVKDLVVRTFGTNLPKKCARFESFPTNVKTTWNLAKKICRLTGGELAHFETMEEFDDFKSARDGLDRSDWLGMKRTKNGRKFKDLKRKDLPFTSWDQFEPNNADGMENCVQANPNSNWNDVSCDGPLGIVCRYEDVC